MSNYAIEVHNVSKRYYIGSQQNQTPTFQQTLIAQLKKPAKRIRALMKGNAPTYSDKELWALQDVSFKVNRGETLGIVGRNGSGKSTLLEIITHITKPTEGHIITRGRLIGLLNVGTGFHPELTGRENIYVNGSILGLNRQEIDAIFDDIVDFSEIPEFIDTPIKRYSSGMRVRLAFSIVIHLQPEIMIFDEVLAVGDPGFREKCVRAIEDRLNNTTVVIVAHNVAYLQRLCNQILWLEKGQIVEFGNSETVALNYLKKIMPDTPETSRGKFMPAMLSTEQNVTLTKAFVLHPKKREPFRAIDSIVPFVVQIEYEVIEKPAIMRLMCNIVRKEDDLVVLSTTDADVEPRHMQSRDPGKYIAEFTMPRSLLIPGDYHLTITFDDPQTNTLYGLWDKAITFRIVDNRSQRSQWFSEPREGLVNIDIAWQHNLWHGKEVETPTIADNSLKAGE